MSIPLEIPPSLACPSCGAVLPLTGEMVSGYLRGEKAACTNCSAQIDLWKTLLENMRLGFRGIFGAYAIAGAQMTAHRISLEPGKPTEIDFDAMGIPSDARILDIGYTPIGTGLLPLEMHGNWPRRHMVQRPLTVYPALIGGGPHTGIDVSLLVVWVHHQPTDYTYQNLVEAAEAFSVDRYEMMVVHANAAVELTLNQLLARLLESHVGSKKVEGFLQDHATYSHQLNILLPAFTDLLRLPKMPKHIHGLLNRLRTLRNRVAHGGFLDASVDRYHAAECLAATFFGLAYLRMIGLMIEEAAARGSNPPAPEDTSYEQHVPPLDEPGPLRKAQEARDIPDSS